MSELIEPTANEYLRTIMRITNEYERVLDAIADQASIAADRVIGGGNLYGLSDDGGSFVAELSWRSGGLTNTCKAPDSEEIHENDFVIVATVGDPTDDLAIRMSACREKGAHVMLIGSEGSTLRAAADGFIPNGLPAGTAPLFSYHGKAICPAAGASNVAAMWLFTAEYVAACTQRGKMPAFYQSGGVPYGSFRNKTFTDHVFYDGSEIQVGSIPTGELGRRYLANLQRCLAGILIGEIGKFEEIGKVAADTLAAGHTVWCDAIGHFVSHQAGSTGNPGLIRYGRPEEKEPAGPVDKNDFYIYNGYYLYPEEEFPKYRELGVRSAWLLGGREAQDIYPVPGEIHIDAYWRFGDASLYIPGHDIKILPVSGVVMTVTLWMIVAEVARHTA
jgi:uncharacterized phosphosugar-binding protein